MSSQFMNNCNNSITTHYGGVLIVTAITVKLLINASGIYLNTGLRAPTSIICYDTRYTVYVNVYSFVIID